jgi:ribosomal protein S18 acetylase RimI-like enzyme
MNHSFKARAAVSNDLPAIVNIHNAAFPGFFMTLLGPVFLRRYYQVVLEYPLHLAFVIEDNSGAVRGFVVGFQAPSLFYQQLRAQKLQFGLAAIGYLILRPQLWLRVFSNARRVDSAASQMGSDQHTVELSSIGIDPLAKQHGFGTKLVHLFLETAKQNQADHVVLTTDAVQNDAVNAFYQKLGFKLTRAFEGTKGRLMNEYMFQFNNSIIR